MNIAPQLSRIRSSGYRLAAFSLVEILVVLAIIGILAGVAAPALKGLGRGTGISAASRQVLDDLGLARQFAIKNRTTVYFLFAPPMSGYPKRNSQFYQDFKSAKLDPFVQSQQGSFAAEVLKRAFDATVGGQFTSYGIYADRRVGDQPGTPRPSYLVNWRVLPDGIIFPKALFSEGIRYVRAETNKLSFALRNAVRQVQFPAVVDVPNALATLRADLPGIAFNQNGQVMIPNDFGHLVIAPDDVALALGEGSVIVPRKNQTGPFDLDATAEDILVETPRNNYTNTIILIAPLSGRAKVHRPPSLP